MQPRTDVPELVPVRMLNEYAYCPRLFYLEWVQGEWADNRFTDEGRYAHRRADAGGGEVPSPEDDRPFKARSVAVSAPGLGLSTKVDVLEGDGAGVVPVEYKRGAPAPVPERVWEPERVQVCAQALALRENGYEVPRGMIWFAETRERVEVPLTDALVERTRSLLGELRTCAGSAVLPPPLEDSPKCNGCSLGGICLPDEVNLLAAREEGQVRRLHPARDDSLPLYVQEHGARIGLSGGVLQVKDRDRSLLAEARLADTSQVCVLGNVQVTTQALREMCNEGVPLSLFTSGGWFYGRVETAGGRNVELRRAQFRAADSPGWCRAFARRIVAAKIANSRTLVRRNHPEPSRRVLDGLAELRESAAKQDALSSLLGVEGTAARLYFSAFPGMLKAPGRFELDFEGRNRRPPKDPVNALLSFLYALLAKDWTLAVVAAGLDPNLGFYHQPRYGRPALALDLMEEFRPIVADSVVLTVINNGVVADHDFVRSGVGVSLKPGARKRLILAYERRMDQLVTHPVFDYRISYRRVLEVQARLLGRHLLGEIPEYPAFLTR